MSVLKVLASGSRGNCYLLITPDETLIIEAGIKYKEILKGLNYELDKVVGCLVTHEHKDHSKSIKDLTENGIDVYSSKGTFEKLGIKNYRSKIVKANKKQQIGNFTILPFNIVHDAEEPLGFLIKHQDIGTLLFITDTCYCEYNFKNVNSILVECNYIKENLEEYCIETSLSARIKESHFELENVIDFLKASDLSKTRNLMLLHLSDKHGDSQIMKEKVEEATGIPVLIAEKSTEIIF